MEKATFSGKKDKVGIHCPTWVCSVRSMMWKFHDFSATQILREIHFGESRSSKNAVEAILGALKLVNLVNVRLQRVQKFLKSDFRASQCVEMAGFVTLGSLTSISRKISDFA